MYLLYLIAYWYTFSKWYILGSWFVTHMLNWAFKKLWLSPLIINAVALLTLGLGIYLKIITNQEVGASILNIYMPIVFASIVMNTILHIIKKVTNYLKNK